MKNKKIIGIVLLVLAGVAGYMGYTQSQGFGSSLSNAIDGIPSDAVMIKYGIAAVLGIVGIILLKK